MPSCALRYCRNYSQIVNKSSRGITYHKFPLPGNRNREKWIKFVQDNRSEKTWQPSDKTIICSEHFREEDCYQTKTGRRFLKKNAVPYENPRDYSTNDVNTPLTSMAQGASRTLSVDASGNITINQPIQPPTIDTVQQNDTEHTILDKIQDNTGLQSILECKSCYMEVTEFLYRCMVCVDYEFCGGCEGRGSDLHHDNHYVLRVPATRPAEEVERVESAVRQVLGTFLTWQQNFSNTPPRSKRAKKKIAPTAAATSTNIGHNPDGFQQSHPLNKQYNDAAKTWNEPEKLWQESEEIFQEPVKVKQEASDTEVDSMMMEVEIKGEIAEPTDSEDFERDSDHNSRQDQVNDDINDPLSMEIRRDVDNSLRPTESFIHMKLEPATELDNYDIHGAVSSSQSNEPPNESRSSDNEQEKNTIKKKRQVYSWIFVKKFENATEGHSDLRKDNSWSVHYSRDTEKGKKVYYRCNEVKTRGFQCSAKRYLLYDATSNAVFMYQSETNHNHGQV